MPLHPHMFAVRFGSIPQAWSFQRPIPLRPSHPPLPPLGRPRLRPCSVALPAFSMCHETQHATYYCVSWQIFRKNLCFPVTTSNYPEEAASRGTYEKITCVRWCRRFLCKLLICCLLSGQADEDAEREVLAVAVAEDELAEVKRLVGGLHAEGLLYDCLSKYGRISV